MKRAITILVAGVLAAGATYGLVYFLGTAPQREMLASRTPELLWLKKEFNLNASEFARLVRLHEGYLPECERRCRLIEEQNQKLGQLLANTTDITPDIQDVLTERARLRAECQAAMPEDLRTPLVLAEYEDRSQAEIAEILNCTSKAVEMRIYRARQQLRVSLGPWLGAS